ncbi:MAG: translocation/assembly module TamB domain-containing protein [Steroidobacteraceae bacterium]
MRKLLRILLLTLLLPLVAASVVIAWLCYTASGLQFALLQLNRVSGLAVQVQGVSGRLAGPLHVEHITLEHERVHIDIDQFDVDLTPAYLLSGLVEINRLQAAQAKVTLKPRVHETPDQPIHFLPGFLRISVDELDIQHAQYMHTNGYTLIATPLQGSADLSRSRLRVRQLNAVTNEFDARGELVLDAGKVLALQASLEAAYRLVNGPVLRGDVKAEGPLTGEMRQLKLNALLHQPHEAIVNGVLAFPDAGWSLQGDATAEKVLLDAWWPQPAFSLGKLAGRFEISNAGMHYVGDVQVPEWSTARLHFDADTHYAQRVFTLDRADISVPATGVQTRSQGTITLQTGGKPLVDMQASWRQLRWPLHASDANSWFVSERGETRMRGTLPYQFEVQGSVRTPQWPMSQVQASGELRSGAIQLMRYSAQTLHGTATGSASLQFGPPRNWQFELNGSNLDPSALQPAWPGALSIRASGKGQGFDKQAQFDVRVQSLAGSLRKQSVKVSGRVLHQGRRWLAEAIDANWGRAHLSAQGSAGPQNNLRWTLTAPALEQLHPGLSGDLNMNGVLTGDADTPQLSLQAQSTHMNYGAWQTQGMTLDTHLDLTDGSDSRIDLTATRIAHGDVGLEKLQLKGEGRMAGHQLRLQGLLATSLLPDGMQLDMQLAGGYAQQQWRGVLNVLQVTDAEHNMRVQLQAPSRILLALDQIDIQSLCLTADGGHACARGAWSSGDGDASAWNIHADLQALPLSIRNAALTESARLQTRINGQLDLAATVASPWQGVAQLRLQDASIRYQSIAGREEVLPISLGEVHLLADTQTVQTVAELRIAEQTVASLTATLERSAGSGLTSWPLSGVFSLSSSDARLVPVFVSEVDRAEGTLAAVLRLSGTAAAPRFSGDVHLLQGELDFYRLNLALRGLQFDAHVDTDRLRFAAQGNAGEGVLNAGGDLNWHDDQLQGNLQLKGERLLVADLPEYRVLASPDLRFDIDRRNIHVKGEVLIPEARLQPKEVVGAVQTSADARFKTDKVFERKRDGWLIDSEVGIRLGENVNFDGLGLQGRLIGGVNTQLRTGDAAMGSGELGINNGSYEIYGQKLDIKRGRLIYDNTPLDDPGLDINAERKINETTVGVNVRGLLRAPRLQFYSDPSMSQTQIVSYLLIGKPLDELQGQETTTVRSASNTLAMQGGGYLAAQLGRRIGLEQVGVETNANNQSALVLGKFLSPRLFVSYGISLTEAINTVKLRYTLSDHWTLKTEAGAARSADIEFKIER